MEGPVQSRVPHSACSFTSGRVQLDGALKFLEYLFVTREERPRTNAGYASGEGTAF